MARALYKFLESSGELEDGIPPESECFFRGEACFATNWNDFQRLFRGRGHSMNEVSRYLSWLDVLFMFMLSMTFCN